MQCKINHNDAGDIPEFLCRTCHPELNLSTAKRAALDAQDHAIAQAARDKLSRHRELAKAMTKLKTCTRNGEPDEGSVNGKIASSMRKKIHRLEQELKR